MNYIAEFLLLFSKNEEETFNIFNSLLESTDYSDLFVNELKRLNQYFYVFDRLINIYLPEVYIHLKNKQVLFTFIFLLGFLLYLWVLSQSKKIQKLLFGYLIDLFIWLESCY